MERAGGVCEVPPTPRDWLSLSLGSIPPPMRREKGGPGRPWPENPVPTCRRWRIQTEGHLEGGDIEGSVYEDPGDSLRAGRGAERALVGDETKGFGEQELQAQIL
jgi:hypothetical protein